MNHNNPRDVLWYANPDFYWQYDSPEVQELAVAAEEAENEDAQTDLIHELAEILAEEAPSAWLFMSPQIRIAREGVTGVSPDKNAEPFYVASIVRGPAGAREQGRAGRACPATPRPPRRGTPRRRTPPQPTG